MLKTINRGRVRSGLMGTFRRLKACFSWTWLAAHGLFRLLFRNTCFQMTHLASNPHLSPRRHTAFHRSHRLHQWGRSNPSSVFKIPSERLPHPPYTLSFADPVFPLPGVACMHSFRSLQQPCSISPGGLPSSERWGTTCRAHCSKPPRLLCTAASAPAHVQEISQGKLLA